MIGSVLIFHNAFIMLVSMLIGRVGVMLITVKMTANTLEYSFVSQFKDLAQNLPTTIIAAIATLAVGLVTSNIWLQSILQCLTMLIVYLAITLLINRATFLKIKDIVILLLKKNG